MPEIKGVEIFAEGTWNGNKITTEILQNLVKAFDATKGFVRPALKLGHNPDQDLLKSDGLPAAGWVSNVYISGKKLLADFVDIPEKIFDLIKKKAYRKVSVEIFSGYTFDGITYPALLSAVALLGSDMPAVMTLSDILGRYSIDPQKFANKEASGKLEIKIFTKDLEDQDMSDVKKEDATNDEIQKTLLSFKADLDKYKGENETIKKEFASYKDAADKKIASLEGQVSESELDKFTSDLTSKGLLSPSMAPFVKALSGVSKAEFSIGDKKYSPQVALEELLKLAKEVYSVNKKENSKKTDEPEGVADKAKELEKKVDDYMKENKVTYSQAYREVMRTEGKK